GGVRFHRFADPSVGSDPRAATQAILTDPAGHAGRRGLADPDARAARAGSPLQLEAARVRKRPAERCWPARRYASDRWRGRPADCGNLIPARGHHGTGVRDVAQLGSALDWG